MISDISTFHKNFKFDKKNLIIFYQKLFIEIKKNRQYNFYNHLFEKEVFEKLNDPKFFEKMKEKKLFGVPFFLKDNFNVKGYKTSGGSSILKDYKPNFNATCLNLLEAQGAILIGKTTMDELSMGGTGLESCDGEVINPFDKNRICGGSSSGSAVAIVLKLASFALGTDTGDSVRAPASYLGIYGFKPTFGKISRFGIIQYAPSLDTVGIFANHLNDFETLIPILFKYDQKDFIMQSQKVFTKKIDHQKINLLVLKSDQTLAHPQNWKLFQKNVLETLKKQNIKYKIFKLPKEITDILNILYKIISFPEALSMHGNLTGINFGLKDHHQNRSFFDTITANRTQNLGQEIKRRYFLGAKFIEGENQNDIFLKGFRIRRFLENYFQELFLKYDAVLHPSTYDISPLKKDLDKFTNVYRTKPICNDFLLIANFLGLPSLSIPFGKREQNSLSLNIFAKEHHDLQVIEIAKYLDNFIKKNND